MIDILLKKFNSVYDFENYTTNTQRNKKAKESSEKIDNDGSWCNTHDYQESINLLQNGYKTKVETIKSALNSFQKTLASEKKIKTSVIGFSPCVSRALSGHPLSMYNYEIKNKSFTTLKIAYNGAVSYDVNSNEIEKQNIKLLKLIMLLENNKIKCELWNFPILSFKGNKIKNPNNFQIVGALVKLKDYESPLNINKIAYPLLHTSFFRRQGFKFLECQDLKYKEHYSGYGASLNYESITTEKLKNELINSKELKNYKYIDWQFLNSSDDLQELAKKLLNNK